MIMVLIVYVVINFEYFLYINVIDFINVINGSLMEMLVILIMVLYKYVI